MSVRTRWAIAVFLAAAAATVSNAYAQPKPGQGSLGARIGVPYFLSDSDTKDGQKPRILATANFGYRISPNWRLMTDFGFGWVIYKDDALLPYKVTNSTDSIQVKQDLMTKIVPIDATLIHVFDGNATKWSPYIGAGFTINRMEIDNQRRKIQDPATFKPWVNWAPGVHAILGEEYFIPANPNVSLDFSLRYTYLFSENTKDFPSGFTGNDSYLDLAFGVNVHFWPGGKKPVEAVAPAPETAPETLTPVPVPAPSDSTQSPAPPDTTRSPAPPDTTRSPAPPDTTQKSPSPQGSSGSILQNAPQGSSGSVLLLNAPQELNAPPEADESGFGAFGVPVPRSEDEGAACAIREKRTLR